MARINYAQLMAKYKSIGKGAVRLTQSSLYLTLPINATQTIYNFEILESQTANLTADQIRLNINDEFICTTLGIYAEGELTIAGVGTGIKRLFTYAPVENVATARLFENLYSGSLQISVNNIVFLDKFDTRKHEFIPQTQFGSFTAGTQNATQSNGQYSKVGMFPIEPSLTLSGSKKNQVQLQLPTAIATGCNVQITDNTGGTTNYAINRVACLMRGLNAQNGSVFQS